jgi:CDP-diacylglycerol---glycerol-3-phosphate 3-phosphatidyltransferase
MRAHPLLAVPSVISLSRVALAGAFIFVRTPDVRAALVVASALTDFLDGWIARVGKVETHIGALLDPITDRLFMLTAVVVLLLDGTFTLQQCVLLLLRDFATSIGFFVAKVVSWLRPVEFKARFPGKVATTLQFLAVIVALLWPAFISLSITVVAVVSVVAIVDYTLALWRARVPA